MTGFGVGRAALADGQVALEVRSLNHRFLEVRVRMPAEASDQGFFVEQLCRERLKRGRYDVTVRLEGASAAQPMVDVERGAALYASLCALRDRVAPGAEVPLALLTSMPDMIRSDGTLPLQDLRAAIDRAFVAAVGDLNAMRDTEGDALRSELEALLGAARKVRKQIAARSPELVAVYRKRLSERIARLKQELPSEVEPGRLETEVALLADRTDVTEELARLASHFDQFEQLLAQADPVGRRLDFLLQEVAREANTIGSKCQDAELSHLVVELKAEVERMREQVQNIE